MVIIMNDAIYIQTDKFEHKVVGEHFINPCCFGEDFSKWLIAETQVLTSEGYQIGEPIQEDYDWGFWVNRGKDPFWIAISLCRRWSGRRTSLLGGICELRYRPEFPVTTIS